MSGRRVVLAGCLVGSLVLAGCATFAPQPPPESWRPPDSFTPQAGPEPQVPGEGTAPQDGAQDQAAPTSVPPPDGCTDFHPAVIATCLNPVAAVAALPGDGSDPVALVAERTTGRILRVRKNTEPVVVATLPVDTGTDGGLTGVALSPNFLEDRLIFAYITTATDNRLVRIAPGDTPKPVLTGIPRGATGNRGALGLDHRGALLLATGDAGNPAAPLDPNSLAGKVLRLSAAGKPAEDNPVKDSAVVASGLHAPGGVCASLDGSRIWLTDRDERRDLLFRLQYGRPLGEPAWTWPDRPGITGCASTPDTVWVTASVAANLQGLPLAADGTFRGKPQITLQNQDGFGRLSGIDLINQSVAVAGTVNKDGGTPVSSDDRAVVIVPAGGPGGSVD
ncbi:MAG TPA: PQQ-dependent sugar dehydrogenase [Actinophytocola sp.]|uniref:PQQ-dependent sugar dehydrogenase n=1 Tax=Actinophytocola sp. TaxID=1872138 RepID=UPI002DB79B48|nr:PQQ-dependent sugar dehydrogenase [Actinophytocola sp.]HEU5470155.1 PQQ-dependent sugar dehydrogenase [Actinophytocola sp.]